MQTDTWGERYARGMRGGAWLLATRSKVAGPCPTSSTRSAIWVSATTPPRGCDIRSPNDLGLGKAQKVHGRTASVPADNAGGVAREAAGGHTGREVRGTARIV